MLRHWNKITILRHWNNNAQALGEPCSGIGNRSPHIKGKGLTLLLRKRSWWKYETLFGVCLKKASEVTHTGEEVVTWESLVSICWKHLLTNKSHTHTHAHVHTHTPHSRARTHTCISHIHTHTHLTLVPTTHVDRGGGCDAGVFGQHMLEAHPLLLEQLGAAGGSWTDLPPGQRNSRYNNSSHSFVLRFL